MLRRTQRAGYLSAIGLYGLLSAVVLSGSLDGSALASAKADPTPTPPVKFDPAAAIARLKEQIKGREKEPASAVWKNVRIPAMKDRAAGSLLAVMEFGYSRSLGVDCSHCHVVDKWDSDEEPSKQVARGMAAMVAKLNGEMLKEIPDVSKDATVNCTTCHRGQLKPALNLPAPKT